MKFGLEENIIEKITHILEEQPKVDKAYIFGSRAKGNYRLDSDIDIAVKGIELTVDDILKMSAAIDKSKIGYEVDLVDYASIKEEALREHVDRIGTEFYSTQRLYRLGDLLEVITKGTTPTTIGRNFTDQGINFIKSEAISYDGRIDKSTFVYIDNETHKLLKRSQLKKDDILFSMAGIFLGKNAIITEDLLPANTNQALAIIRLNKEISIPKYVHYFLRQQEVIDFINNMSGQSAQPNINFEEIKSIEILLPSKEQQEVIAKILSNLDDKIDLLRRQNNTLESMAEVLFRQWFGEEAEDCWEEKKLTEIAKYLNGLALQNFPANGNKYLPVIKIKEMKQGNTENSDFCDINIPIDYVVNNGDVLFSWSGSLEVALWAGKVGALNQHLFKISSQEYPKWLYYLATKYHLAYFKVVAESKSTTMGHIQRHHLEDAKINIPPKTLLEKMNSVFEPLILKEIINNEQILSLLALRDTLLPKLISGEARVKMPE